MLSFTEDIKYSLDGKAIEKHIFKSGESYSLDSVLNALGKDNVDFFIRKGVITQQAQDDTQDPVQTTQDPVDSQPIDNTQDPVQDPVDPDPVVQQAQDDTQDPVQTTQELTYKTTEALVTPEGAKIKKGTMMTKKEILEAGLDFPQLITDGKLLELKITK